MARVTVDDSLSKVDNRFQLVLLASKRARDLTNSGIEPEVSAGRDKPTVIALREIAAGKITADYLLKKSPEVKPMRPVFHVADDVDFDMDDEANAALISALTSSTSKKKSKSDQEASNEEGDHSESEE
jgi:DNA-directed RNA polymerase subunit omega